jgi:nitroreductase
MADFDSVVRTAFAARKFTDQAVAADDLIAILDLARFASSGGNAQGWRVVVARSAAVKTAVIEAGVPTARHYVAQGRRGERGFNTIHPSGVTDAEVEAVDLAAVQWYRDLALAPVVLVIGVDLRLVASIDAGLARVGLVSGASIYPFVHNVLLAAHARAMAGVITTFAVGAEDEVKAIVGFEPSVALAAVVALGYPARVLTKLTRNPVEDFARWDHWTAEPVRSGSEQADVAHESSGG